MNKRIGYLLVGHGTRNIAGQQQFATVFSQFAERMAPDLASFAYLELAKPDISQAVAQLAADGATHLITVPAFLFAAGHALQDIPQAVESAARAHGLQCAGQSPPLELSPSVLELSALRFRQAVCHTSVSPQCFERCEGGECQSVGLAFIGRGSRSEEATERMRQFARLRRQITPVADLEIGFVFAQRPNVDECLRRMSESRCSTIVIQPHLLFEGELIQQLREQAANYSALNTHQRWVVTSTLGTDFALAQTLSDLARLCNGSSARGPTLSLPPSAEQAAI